MRRKLPVLGLIFGVALAIAASARGTLQQQNVGVAKQKQQLTKQNPAAEKIVVDIEMTDVWADNCRVWIRVTNKGNVKIDKLLREVVWVDGEIKDNTQMHYVLEPGAVFAHGVSADPGLKIIGLNRNVKAQIDVDGALSESALNRANNTKNVTLSCMAKIEGVSKPMQALSDLTVSFDFKNVIRKDPNADGKYIWWTDIEFTVTNNGPGPSVACVILLESDQGTGGAFSQAGPEISIPVIDANHTYVKKQTSYQHTGPAPTYKATVDAHNVVHETNETNNTFTKKFPY
jgi:archaellum component FlaF (FlaF/FlaG flagellin family)